MTLPLIKAFQVAPQKQGLWVSVYNSCRVIELYPPYNTLIPNHTVYRATSIAQSCWLRWYTGVCTLCRGECGCVCALKRLVVFMLYSSVLVCTSNLAGGRFQQALASPTSTCRARTHSHTTFSPPKAATLSFFVNVGYFSMQTRNWMTPNTLLSALHIVTHVYARS